jgi:hypothetical protein
MPLTRSLRAKSCRCDHEEMVLVIAKFRLARSWARLGRARLPGLSLGSSSSDAPSSEARGVCFSLKPSKSGRTGPEAVRRGMRVP